MNAWSKGLAIALGWVAVCGTSAYAQKPSYFPVARVAVPDGYALTVVQPPVPNRDACVAANKRFTDSLTSGCSACKVTASQCKTALNEQERAASAGKRLWAYSVGAGPVRVIVTGKKDTARVACEQIAATMVKEGVKNAACLKPGEKP